MDNSSHAVLALTNRLVDAGAEPLPSVELWSLLAEVADPARLLGRSATDLATELPASVDAERIARLLDTGVALAARLESLREHGIWALTPFDDDYPSRLRERLAHLAPPLLYGAGDASLLAEPGIGIVGSRDVSERGAEVAADTARAAAGARLPVISGGARGVDSIAMNAALEAGGTVVGILADSLKRSITKADIRRALLDGTACLCTPYGPDSRWSVGIAMGRNKVVYAMSRVTLVVASDKDEGGTWSGAKEALAKSYGAVAVWRGEGEGPGNEALEKAGATGVSDVSAVVYLEEQAPRPEPAHQMTLGEHPPAELN